VCVCVWHTINPPIHSQLEWIGCGAKLNLSKSPIGNVLKRIIMKLQQRVQVGVVTFLVKVKTHRGDPLNEEVDIIAEIGLRKEQKEVIWDNPTNRTVYQSTVGPATRSTTWTSTIRNRFHQKAGEIQAFRALEQTTGIYGREKIETSWGSLFVKHKSIDKNTTLLTQILDYLKKIKKNIFIYGQPHK
jgi:hypothetical protein